MGALGVSGARRSSPRAGRTAAVRCPVPLAQGQAAAAAAGRLIGRAPGARARPRDDPPRYVRLTAPVSLRLRPARQRHPYPYWHTSRQQYRGRLPAAWQSPATTPRQARAAPWPRVTARPARTPRQSASQGRQQPAAGAAPCGTRPARNPAAAGCTPHHGASNGVPATPPPGRPVPGPARPPARPDDHRSCVPFWPVTCRRRRRRPPGVSPPC